VLRGLSLSRERGNPALRLVDRYVGIPVVAAGGALRRRRALPSDIRRIGVLNSTNIGDTVLLAPVLEDIAAAFPEAEVLLFSGPSNHALARLVEGVTPVPIQLSSPLAAVRTIRAQEVDVAIDFDQWPRVEPVLCLLSGARWTAGFRSPGQHRHRAFDAHVEHSDERHELDNYRHLASALGVESSSLPRVRPPGELDADALPSTPYAVLHLWPTGVRSDLKEWPWERWRELAAELDARGFGIVLTGSAADAPQTQAFADSCGELGGRFVDAAGKYDLAQVVDLLSGSACVVSVNTGVMHLAAASGAPTVGLNGPTSERRWGPLGERALSVNSRYDGCGYLHFGWEYRGRREDCMLGIPVERVLAAVTELTSDR
jgi:lipopolysaccharide heptosyltransferase III